MASARRIELLLTSNVENLGIVGDLVRVRMGFA
ncbi:MAG: 50S ribosomal protein L9, partial [Phycisphaerales bacterium]